MSELYLPVRVNTSNVPNDQASAVLDLINRHTLEPIQSIDQLYTFEGNCSNDQLDSYSTKMDPNTTLRNYERDLKTGVALLPGHDISKTPYGRSYDGKLQIADQTAVRGYWYILRDTVINGENTNDTIKAMKAGIIRDMSVGFGGSELWYRCSSCNRDLWNSECPHFPGLVDEKGDRTFAWIMDAILREVSTVYKGATPDAYIDKAREYAKQGQLSEKEILRLENAYSIRLDKGKRSFYMPKNNEEDKKEVKTMNELLDQLREAVRENKVEKGRIYDILTENGEPFRQPEDIALRNELGRDFVKPEAIRTLKKEAQQGRRYLADMVDEAVASRVKAQGDAFNADSYRAMLNHSGDIDSIKEEIDAYNRQAKERFTPGRQTEPEPLGGAGKEEPAITKIDPNENFFEDGDK